MKYELGEGDNLAVVDALKQAEPSWLRDDLIARLTAPVTLRQVIWLYFWATVEGSLQGLGLGWIVSETVRWFTR